MRRSLFPILTLPLLMACGGHDDTTGTDMPDSTATTEFQWEAEQFGDIRVLRYQVPGWDQLSLQQKQLSYYLNMAGLAGRDIMWDQNYKHNLKIRRALEAILAVTVPVTFGRRAHGQSKWAFSFLSRYRTIWATIVYIFQLRFGLA